MNLKYKKISTNILSYKNLRYKNWKLTSLVAKKRYFLRCFRKFPEEGGEKICSHSPILPVICFYAINSKITVNLISDKTYLGCRLLNGLNGTCPLGIDLGGVNTLRNQKKWPYNEGVDLIWKLNLEFPKHFLKIYPLAL